MKQLIVFLVFVVTVCSCASPTRIVSSWRDPNTTISNPHLHKIVVAALIYDQGVRHQVEDYMASLYPGTAIQSYTIFGADSLLANESACNQVLKAQGFDGIVLMRQVNMNVTDRFVPGQGPRFYNSWGGYWGRGWGVSYYYPGTPGHYALDRTWTVQVNVYAVLTGKLIWSADTHTTDPGGRVPLFTDVCDAVRKEMKKQGFLK